jgi:hypothetical protein
MLSRFARLAALVGHARARNLVIACGLLLGLALAAVGAWIINDLRLDHISHEKKDLTNLSYILAEEMDRRLEVLDLLHRGLIEHMRQIGVASPEAFQHQMGSIEVHHDLSQRIAGLPQIAALSLHDRTGSLINFSRFWPPPQIDVRDRDSSGRFWLQTPRSCSSARRCRVKPLANGPFISAADSKLPTGN